MPSESSDHPRTTTAKTHTHTTTSRSSTVAAPPHEPEHLPCPRCGSTNTKFCYYNNYNFSQPRHFCKSCRRYWTHGGTLRDIPVGGGSRKNSKRSRLTTTSTTNIINSNLEFRHLAPPATTTPFLFPSAGEQDGGLHFTLNSNHGFFGGFEDGNFAFGRGVWPFSGMGDGGCYAAGGGGGGGGNMWQVEGGEGGGGCFSLSDLAISTPGMI